MESNHEIVTELEGFLTSGASPEDAYTTEELVDMTGRPHNWVRSALRQAVRGGTWECVRVRRFCITGSAQRVPGYRPVAKSKGKRKR